MTTLYELQGGKQPETRCPNCRTAALEIGKENKEPKMKSHLEEDFSNQIRLCQLPEPMCEFRFHPKRQWRFDFAWLEKRIAAEVEGGTMLMYRERKSRHTHPTGYRGDCEKYNAAQQLGWKVYRFTGDMVADGSAIQFLEEVLKNDGITGTVSNK